MGLRWDIRQPVENDSSGLACELGIHPVLAGILINRGLGEPPAAEAFLHPRLSDLHDPLTMKDMDRVVGRILLARERGEKILIYGDYDVDGITSTVVLRRALEILRVEVDFYLPKRLEDGYGLRTHVIQWAADQGYRLVITADSGIRAFEVCQVARDRGIDLIVTDHHLPDNELPCAWAIINPKQPGCNYPDKDLAAVGVIFKLVQALFEAEGLSRYVEHFLKLVAIGTIADLVPLRGENRVIAKLGLAGLAEPHNIGLKALLEGAGVGQEVSHFDVGFKLAPRINAVTRMGGGREVVDLFAVQDDVQARQIVDQMNQKNLQRREVEDRILQQILARAEENPADFEKKFILVSGRDWHRGVIGIVASRLVERFYRPVLVISQSDEMCQGSGRSIPGFHLLNALESCRDLFAAFGGHTQAVGCSFEPKDYTPSLQSELSTRLEAYAAEQLGPDDLVPSIAIESLLPVEDLTLGFYAQLNELAPFGIGNPLPIFASRQVEVVGGPWILKEKHLKFKMRANGSAVDAVWWRQACAAQNVESGSRLDLAYSLGKNTYRGLESLQVTVKDIRTGVGQTPDESPPQPTRHITSLSGRHPEMSNSTRL